MGVPQNGWLVRENLLKMDDLRVPLFQETIKYVLSMCPSEVPVSLFNHFPQPWVHVQARTVRGFADM